MKTTKKKGLYGLAVVLMSGGMASATDAATVIAGVICSLVPEVINLAWALALLVFIYGGAKYAYSADDPGQRKAAKGVAINALIGFIIVGASRGVVTAIAKGAPIC
jgi:hypothetical protein